VWLECSSLQGTAFTLALRRKLFAAPGPAPRLRLARPTRPLRGCGQARPASVRRAPVAHGRAHAESPLRRRPPARAQPARRAWPPPSARRRRRRGARHWVCRPARRARSLAAPVPPAQAPPASAGWRAGRSWAPRVAWATRLRCVFVHSRPLCRRW